MEDIACKYIDLNSNYYKHSNTVRLVLDAKEIKHIK